MSVKELGREAEDLGVRVERLERKRSRNKKTFKVRKKIILPWLISASLISLSSYSSPLFKKDTKPIYNRVEVKECFEDEKTEVDKERRIPEDLNNIDVKVSDYALVIDKSEYMLGLYLKLFDEWHFVKDYPIATGLNSGDKERPKDFRTPNGIYYITHMLTTIKKNKNYSKKLVGMNKEWHRGGRLDGGDLGYDAYGTWYFGINYPNKEDKLRGKTGFGIGIHGTCDVGSIYENASGGCLRMYNPDIEELAYFVKPRTPVIIRERVRHMPKNNISIIEAMELITNDFDRLSRKNTGRLPILPEK